MIIRKYGVELIRLERQYIEILRRWRNSPEIVANMEFQQHITPEMQSAWFERINNLENFYFIIQHEGTMLGLIHLSGLDKGIADSGIFIKNENYINTIIPVLASLSLLDFAFYGLKLKAVTAKVKKTNKRAYNYNKRLGFIYKKDFVNTDFLQLIINEFNYLQSANILRIFATSQTPKYDKIIFNDNLKIDAKIQAYLNSKKESLPE